MADLPSGTVTFLFTDVDGSTELVKKLGERYGAVLAKHRSLLRAAFAEHAGTEVDTQGDAFFVAFSRARDAVAAAIASQRALANYPWAHEAPISVCVGLHTREPYRAEHGYTGVAVHRAARICTIPRGGQVLLSRSTAGIVDDEEIPGIALRDLGECGLKDIERPERVYQLVVEGLRSDFPPPRTVDRQIPLVGTVTIVLTEGRRMMRLARELTPEQFGALLSAYRTLLAELFEEMGGREVSVTADSAVAAFPTEGRHIRGSGRSARGRKSRMAARRQTGDQRRPPLRARRDRLDRTSGGALQRALRYGRRRSDLPLPGNRESARGRRPWRARAARSRGAANQKH